MNELGKKLIEAVVILGVVLLMTGCGTIKGMAGDTAWLLQTAADNIQPAEQQ